VSFKGCPGSHFLFLNSFRFSFLFSFYHHLKFRFVHNYACYAGGLGKKFLFVKIKSEIKV